MKYIFAIIAGLFVGVLSHEAGGYIVGGIIGLLLVQFADLKAKIFKLENQLKNKSTSRSIQPITTESINNVVDDPSPEIDAIENNKEVQSQLSSDKQKLQVEPIEVISQTNKPKTIAPRPVKTGPTAIEKAFSKIKSMVVGYFTGGNSLVRTGMLVLFIGVAFLLKYVAERTVVPIEYRYIGVILGCLVMLVLGWKLRKKRLGFALSLEGGGIGLLYITLFAALRLHNLLPPHIVLLLLIGIVVFSAVLAVFQDSMALAIIGMLGGFAAPILTSTGSGSHVQLFSYYLLLNIGVFAIAWFKSWRILNVLGFVATFGIGSLWGFKYYKPEFLFSVEPFLVAYFLLYTFIAVLFALKQPPKLKGINDGTIIFGTPLVGFALQAALMKDSVYGLAYSALALGIFYVLLAFVIKRMKKPYMKDLIESFVALGIGFATLAIPLGFDGRVTSAMWVAEGCALLWVGIRQSRMLPRFSGYALSVLGMIAFFVEKKSSADLMPWLNADYIGALIIFFATAFIGLHVRNNSSKLLSLESNWIPSFMVIASLCWWTYGGMLEIYIHYFSLRFVLFEIFLAIITVALLFFATKHKFNLLKILSIIVALCMVLVIESIPSVNTENNMIWNVRFSGLMVLSLLHVCLSWYWSFDLYPKNGRHKLSNTYNYMSHAFLFTGLSSWLYVWVIELSAYYPVQQFVLIESMMALSTLAVLLIGIQLKLQIFKQASAVTTLLMLLPFVLMPQSNEMLPAMINIPFMGLLVYTMTQLGISWCWQRDKSLASNSLPMQVSSLLLILGISAWIYMGHNEISTYLSVQHLINTSIVFMSVSFVVWLLMAYKLQWKSMHLLSYAYLPYLIGIGYYTLGKGYDFHDGYGIFVWLFAALVNYWILKIYDNKTMQGKGLYHLASLLLFVFIVVYEFRELIEYTLGSSSIWHQASASLVLLLLCIGLFTMRNISLWPFNQYKTAYIEYGLLIMSVILWLMLMAINISAPGLSTIINYVPILNIIDLVGIVFIIFAWKLLASKSLSLMAETNKIMMIALPITAFFILNTSMLRCFHFWYSIDYKFSPMISSFMVQSAFSILWSLTAVLLMVMSTRKHWRVVWLVGLGLMIAVVIKLFLVDMSASGTVERIVAFLSVGLLLSLVGYFSPLPPDIVQDKAINNAVEKA